jgi:hypothetical protein
VVWERCGIVGDALAYFKNLSQPYTQDQVLAMCIYAASDDAVGAYRLDPKLDVADVIPLLFIEDAAMRDDHRFTPMVESKEWIHCFYATYHALDTELFERLLKHVHPSLSDDDVQHVSTSLALRNGNVPWKAVYSTLLPDDCSPPSFADLLPSFITKFTESIVV